MRKKVQRILSMLCALALLLGCAPLAMGEGAAAAAVISVSWADANNQDGLRPAAVTATLTGDGAAYDQVTLNEENNWTGMLAAPAQAGDSAVSYSWQIAEIQGYSVSIGSAKGGTTVATLTHEPAKVSASLKWTWKGDENAPGARPDAVNAVLLADGKACGMETLNADGGWAASWKDLPKYAAGKEIGYAISAPEINGYDVIVSGNPDAGFGAEATLKTGKLTVKRTVQGAAADPAKLSYEVSGPDSRLPVTVTGESFVLENAAPGSYLVKEKYQDGAAEGYELDPEKSITVNAVRVPANGEGYVQLVNVFVPAQEKPEGEEKPAEAPADLSALAFLIDGPDEKMPMTLTYGQFTGGKYTLENLACGTYTVIETNAGKLLDEFTLAVDSSNQGILVQVNGGAATAKLTNVYLRNTPAPTETPEATATPEPTEEPTPGPQETVRIPVVKNWVDHDNRDGNRPEQVTVRLLADGSQVASAVLSAANNWSHVFEEMPKQNGDADIVYTVTEDSVPLYDTVVNGFVVTNVYSPEVTSAQVIKIWDDKNNAAGLRPTSILAILSCNGKKIANVVLNEANGWSAKVENLPKIINGAPAVYTWSEQEVLAYRQTNLEVNGTTTTITNSFHQRPTPGPGGPKNPGTPILIIEDYGTPLGVEIMINHVGDCFD